MVLFWPTLCFIVSGACSIISTIIVQKLQSLTLPNVSMQLSFCVHIF